MRRMYLATFFRLGNQCFKHSSSFFQFPILATTCVLCELQNLSIARIGLEHIRFSKKGMQEERRKQDGEWRRRRDGRKKLLGLNVISTTWISNFLPNTLSPSVHLRSVRSSIFLYTHPTILIITPSSPTRTTRKSTQYPFIQSPVEPRKMRYKKVHYLAGAEKGNQKRISKCTVTGNRNRNNGSKQQPRFWLPSTWIIIIWPSYP